jgi:class 3 adenylate cyclase
LALDFSAPARDVRSGWRTPATEGLQRAANGSIFRRRRFFEQLMEKVLSIGTATSRLRTPPAQGGEVVEFPAASERTSRTFVCTVLFLDIVEYSRKPVAEQLLIKERFNHHVAQAIGDIPLADRIILDTGDGVAVNFLGDPEDALFVALRLSDAFARDPGPGQPIQVRAGVNLGPVRLARDINGQPNIIGDGINVAQRVMTFAHPGQVLVSRSYHEVVTRISDEYERLFAYQGSRTDKHVREHEIYELEPATPGVRTLIEKRRQIRRKREPSSRSTHAFGILSHRGLALGVLTGSTLAFVASLLVTLQPKAPPSPAPAKRIAAAPPAPPPAEPITTPAPPVAVMPEVELASPADPPAVAPGPRRTPAVARPAVPAAEPEAPATEETPGPAQPALAPWASVATPAPPAQTTPPAPAKPAGPTALVVLAISPWGEVYVNGKSMGVSPPLQEIELPKGKHRIVVRNGSFKPFEEDFELGSNETVRIKHKFTAR